MLIFGTTILLTISALGIVASDPDLSKNEAVSEKVETDQQTERSSQILEYINSQAQRRKYALRFQK